MKKILITISAALALLMLLPLAAFAAKDGESLPFSDVKSGKWYYEGVKRVWESELMKGVSATEFDPNGTLTRGMCATILYRAANEPAVSGFVTFADVKDSAYYADAVKWAKRAGIVNGRTETTFDPDGKITREEFATMLYRFLNAADLTLPETRGGGPTDADKVASYASEAVGAMYRSGIVNGRENGAFDPGADITRAETAAMLDRFVEGLASILRWDDVYHCVRVNFAIPDAEEGFFGSGSICDVSVGYIPGGLNVYENEFNIESAVIREIQLSPEKDFDFFSPFIQIRISGSDAFEWGWAPWTFEKVYLSEINGMDAYVYEMPTELEGHEIDITVIMFGDRDVTVSVFGWCIGSDEVWNIAESITANPAD